MSRWVEVHVGWRLRLKNTMDLLYHSHKKRKDFFPGDYFYFWDVYDVICDKKNWRKYGLFMQNKNIRHIPAFFYAATLLLCGNPESLYSAINNKSIEVYKFT